MQMGKSTCLVFLLCMGLVIGVSDSSAQPIQPAGKTIGSDGQTNTIYQVPANGINIGYKLVGSGEPLVLIMGLGSTMEHWPTAVIETLSKTLALAVPGAWLVQFKNATHQLMFEAPAGFAKVVLAFLGNNETVEVK
jgi:pimeloyl-ACP methyl ester carboxylesterase